MRSMTLSQTSMQAPQLMQSSCRPSRMSMPVADLHAQRAVDAVTEALGSRITALAPRAAVLAAGCVVKETRRVSASNITLWKRE